MNGEANANMTGEKVLTNWDRDAVSVAFCSGHSLSGPCEVCCGLTCCLQQAFGYRVSVTCG